MNWWTAFIVLAACGGPSLDVKQGRSVIMEVEAYELVDVCSIPCQRVLRAGELVQRCSMQASGWNLSPVFAGETNPPIDTKTFDMATILGPKAAGFAVCTVGGSK